MVVRSALPFLAVAAVGCNTSSGAVDVCTQEPPVEVELSVSMFADPAAPANPANVGVQATVAHECFDRPTSVEVRSAALYKADRTTKILDLELEFAGGELTLDEAHCLHNGSPEPRWTEGVLTVATVANDDLNAYCGEELWVSVEVVRGGCDPESPDARVIEGGGAALVGCP